MDHLELKVKLLHPLATLPAYQSAGAAGMDLTACLPEYRETGLAIEPGAIVVVSTGIAIAVPRGFEGQVRPRSGLASKFGVTLPNTPGTIDSDYRGEVKIPLINLGKTPYVVRHADRIAQLIIAPVLQARIVSVEELGSTDRGAGGFGSTGTA